jgi:predicted RecB family endonuclease
MTDVNEEIVRQYMETQGFFVRTDILVWKAKEQTQKKSSGYGDIDLLAEDSDGRRYLIEVKGWHTESIAPNYFRNRRIEIDRLTKEKAAQLFHSHKFETVLVVPRLGIEKEEVRRLARQHGFDQIWEFKDILKQLIQRVVTNVPYDSEVLQTIRLLKIYKFIEQRERK